LGKCEGKRLVNGFREETVEEGTKVMGTAEFDGVRHGV